MPTTEILPTAELPVAVDVQETSQTIEYDSTPDHGSYHSKPPLKLQLITLSAVVGPFLGLIAAIILLWGTAFSWTQLAIFFAMYVITAMGVTVGFHRLFTHRAFVTPKPIAALLAIAASMSVQGPLFYWVATHRRHHHFSDAEGDPHSPHLHGDTVMGAIRGMAHSHVGWLFKSDHRALSRYITDLKQDPLLCRISQLFPLWVALGLLLPTVVSGLITMTWMGALLGFLWGGLARIFFCHHVTWSINSVCHIWGSRPFKSDDESRNNLVFGVLAFGEGWHNNHHAFPSSARHGLRWWQIDMSYWFIRGLAMVKLASHVRVPTTERMNAKLAK